MNVRPAEISTGAQPCPSSQQNIVGYFPLFSVFGCVAPDMESKGAAPDRESKSRASTGEGLARRLLDT